MVIEASTSETQPSGFLWEKKRASFFGRLILKGHPSPKKYKIPLKKKQWKKGAAPRGNWVKDSSMDLTGCLTMRDCLKMYFCLLGGFL